MFSSLTPFGPVVTVLPVTDVRFRRIGAVPVVHRFVRTYSILVFVGHIFLKVKTLAVQVGELAERWQGRRWQCRCRWGAVRYEFSRLSWLETAFMDRA
jgi:hypothetical protein